MWITVTEAGLTTTPSLGDVLGTGEVEVPLFLGEFLLRNGFVVAAEPPAPPPEPPEGGA